jgi:hypothetical protein
MLECVNSNAPTFDTPIAEKYPVFILVSLPLSGNHNHTKANQITRSHDWVP